jgi:hypothetical protein
MTSKYFLSQKGDPKRGRTHFLSHYSCGFRWSIPLPLEITITCNPRYSLDKILINTWNPALYLPLFTIFKFHRFVHHFKNILSPFSNDMNTRKRIRKTASIEAWKMCPSPFPFLIKKRPSLLMGQPL